MILASVLAWKCKNKSQHCLQKDIVEPSANLFPPFFSSLKHDGKSRGVSMTGNECLANPFGTLLLFQQSQRHQLAAPSVGHLGMIPHLIKFSGSVCFPEDSSPGQRVALSEAAYCVCMVKHLKRRKRNCLPVPGFLRDVLHILYLSTSLP